MRRLAIVPLLLALAAGCPRDRKPARDSAAIAVDTNPADLSQISTALPPAAPDTFTPPKEARRSDAPSYPPAPKALMEAVEREQAFSKFCYQEFGQKVDPTLRGGVAMLVTVGGSGITDAHVASDSWSARTPGRAVNSCLNEKAKQAWKLTPGVVKAGRYVVPLTFRGG